MKKTFRVTIYLLACLLCGQVSAQKSVDFGLVQGSRAALDFTEVIDSSKWKRANAIYQKLVNARGDFRYNAPPLKLSGDEAHIAFLEAGGQSIGLELRAYELLDEYGDDALAFILGHEVCHFYEKHGKPLGDYQELLDVEFNNVLSEAKKMMNNDKVYDRMAHMITRNRKRGPEIANEVEADYLGGFLAYSAGYDISQVPEIFGKLYAEYKLDTAAVFGYVSMNERQQMARKAMAKLDEFISIFELANVLTVMRRYPEARTIYRYILKEYQGREIYNNLGVLTTLEAINMTGFDDLYFTLPLELDLNFAGSSRGGDNDKKLREALLREALGYFNAAINLDQGYATGYLNIACVHYVLRDYERANFYANIEAMQKAQADPKRFPTTIQNITILDALIKLNNNQKERGKAILDSLKDQSALALLNLIKAKDDDDEDITGMEPPRLPTPKNFLYWSVSGLMPKNLITETSKVSKAKKELTLFGDLMVRVWHRDQAKLYQILKLSDFEAPTVMLAISDPDSKEKYEAQLAGQPPKEFGVGSSAEEIKAYYGLPQQVISTPAGEVWQYNNDHFLILGQNGKLKRWIVTKFSS